MAEDLQILKSQLAALRAKPSLSVGERIAAYNLEQAIKALDVVKPITVDKLPTPVSITGGLTDTELRATAVPVSATDLDIRNLVFATDKVDASGSTSVGVTGTFFQATQPVSAAALPLPAGAATETTLAAIDAGIPAGLGQTTMAASMPVTVASNQTELPINFPLSNLSAFGTLESAELTPVFQGDFVYGLNSQSWSTPVINGGAAVTPTGIGGEASDAGRLKITSGVTSGAYGYVTSRKIIRYRAGQGNIARFTPLFTAGVADNIQLWGVGYIVSNAPYDGYFFGYNGTAFGVAHYKAGTPAWTAQTSWNGDKVDGTAGTSFTWDKTFGSPVMIKYPYLGYGDIAFFVQVPTTARWVLVHTIRYANTTAATQLSNPSLQFMGFTANSAGTGGSVTMYCGSVGIFLSGARNFAGGPRWAADSAGMAAVGTGIKVMGTTESCLLSLRNCTTYNGVTNRTAIRLNSLSVGASSNNTNLIIRLLIGTTFTTTPVYTPVSGTTADNGVTLTGANEVISVDVAGTTVTSIANRGTYIFNISICGNTSQIIDLTQFDLYLNPGEILTITGQGTASTNTTASINWSGEL